jgi:hypothetical protein
MLTIEWGKQKTLFTRFTIHGQEAENFGFLH